MSDAPARRVIDTRVVNIDELPLKRPETARQIVNDSDADLAYISVSTMMPTEVCEYPDSGKIAAFGGEGPNRAHHVTMADAAVDYWKGEE